MPRREKKAKPKPEKVEKEEKNDKKGKGGKGDKADKSKKKGEQPPPKVEEEYKPSESKFKYINVKEVPIRPKKKMKE